MICVTCGVEQEPQEFCPVCADERQYIGLHGQKWTTLESLRESHRNVIEEEEPGVWSIRTEPGFAIGQRAYLIRTPEGNLLWDCVTLLDEATIRAVNELGGVRAMAVSHAHYFSTMALWSETFDAPLWIHALDEQWVLRRPEKLRLWSGDGQELFGGLRLVRSGGHFAGYQVAHWDRAPGYLFAGDQPQVCMDRRWVSFMWSYPNIIPFNASTVRRITASLAPLEFDRIYGAFGRNVLSGAKEVIARSEARYLRAIAD